MSNQIAQTILAQLGGNKFIAMTGASELVAGPQSLAFKIGRNAGKVTHCTIGLDDRDEYSIQFYKCRGVDVKSLGLVENVQAENLARIFSDKTGMAVTL